MVLPVRTHDLFHAMEGLGAPFLRSLYKRRAELVKAANDAGVHVHNFCEEFFRALKLIGYDGYLGLNLGATPSLVDDYRRSVERIQAIASRLKLKVEV